MKGRSQALWAIGIIVLFAASALSVGELAPLSTHRAADSSTGSYGGTMAAPTPRSAASPVLDPRPQMAQSSSGSPPGSAAPRVVGPNLPLAHYPAAWGTSHLPPGAPGLSLPEGGSAKLDHDQPSLNPFSSLPGSGGNVTWNVTLPIERNASLNQSNLYNAVWFGMVLADPSAYDGQCFLEVQLYPDTNGNYLPQAGVWSGFAVGWQINLTSDVEDSCFAAPLRSGHSDAPFQMNQGNTFTVRMLGWIGSPFGENVTITDDNTGVSSPLTLTTPTGYPLDPAYLANNLDDALLWSSGGNLPISFSFGTGYSSTGPTNNSFGGCNAGVPPPTSLNPSTPCASYDPQNWADDTLQPWLFGPTKFFTKTALQTAVQVGFDSSTGGINWVNPLSLGSCQGRDGSAYCSYPWYSYDRTLDAIQFGATDYFGTTYDFGQYLQYDSTLTTNTAALGYYPVANYTAPLASGGDDLTITIDNLGLGTPSVHFLNYTLTATTTLDSLPSGAYSINSVPGADEYFDDYSTTGSATIDAADTPWSSFHLTGTTAGVTVEFVPVPAPTVGLHINIPGAHGWVGIGSGFNLGTIATYPGLPTAQSAAATWTNESNGGNDMVTPGMYSIQAMPAPGYNFTGWSITGNAYLFAPDSPYTWVNVSSTGGAPTLTANFAASTWTSTVIFESVPATGGTITFGGHVYTSGSSVTLAGGTYAATATANVSYTFETWSYRWSASMSDFASPTQVVVPAGTSYLYALFYSTPSITLAVAGTGTGAIALNGALESGTVTLPEQVEAAIDPIVAVPGTGSYFAGWTVSSGAALWVANLSGPVTSVTVNASATLTATFTSGTEGAVTFVTEGSGEIVWNFNQPSTGTFTNDTVTPGTYSIAESPGVAATFIGWNTTGHVSLVTLYSLNGQGEWVLHYELKVAGAGTVYASFVSGYPVTFVDVPSVTSTVATFEGTGPLAGTTVAIDAGTTALLLPGTYSVTVSGGAIATVRWVGTSNLTLSAATGLTVTAAVSGSATLYALALSLPLAPIVAVSPSVVEPGVPFTVSATVAGGTSPFTYRIALASSLAGAFTCTPANFTSLNGSGSSVCTLSVSEVGSYSYSVYANVTDALNYSSSGTGSVQVFWPPSLTFSSPISSDQIPSTMNLSLTVSWANTVPPAALPGLEETVGLVDQATNAYVTNTPTLTRAGLDSLWIPAGSTNSVTLGPADLLAGSRVAPGSYWVAVSFWSTADLNSDGHPTIFLYTVQEPLTVADVQLLSPASGTSTAAGDVTLAYALNGPGITQAQLTVKNQSGLVSTTALALQPASGTGDVVLSLGAGDYTANLVTYNGAANVWLNSSSTFTVVPAPTVPPVNHYHNTTSIPGYVSYVYTGLLALGTLIGLLIMWVVTRRRREPPAQLAPLTPAAVPPAVAPGVPQGIPPGPAEWDESGPSGR